jgi:type III secretory pathway lipoprotein EscJ
VRSLFLIVLMLALAACKEPILHNLTENEGNKLLTRLHERGIMAEKQLQSDGTWALAVSRKDAIPALSLLSHARVFRRLDSTRSELASGMLPNRETQRFQYERALASDIESTLMALTGVLESRVHLNLPPTDPIFGRSTEKEYHSSGSVLLITDETFQEVHREIQILVAGAAGISPDSISVLISGPQSPAGIDVVAEASSNEQAGSTPLLDTSQTSSSSVTPEMRKLGTYTVKTEREMPEERMSVEAQKEAVVPEPMSKSVNYLLWGFVSILCLVFVALSSRYRQRSIWRQRAQSRRRDELANGSSDIAYASGGAA